MRNLKSVVAAIAILAAPVHAQTSGGGLDDLFTALRTAEGADGERIAGKITSEWSRSGSAAMDVLLDRGKKALDAGDYRTAIDHLGAAIDHAPDFAEAYHLRATAFFQQRRLGLALDDLRMALTLNPRHFGAMTGLAVILEDFERDALALDAWREVMAIWPDHPEAGNAIERLERKVEGRTL